jgi:hypothetical protein
MTEREPEELIGLAEPMVAPDGSALWLKFKTEHRTIDLAVPADQLGELVYALVGSAEFMSGPADEDQEPPNVNFHPVEYRGIGLVAGRHSDETMLVVVLACGALGFPIDGSTMAKLGASFSQTALTVSVGRGPPN